MIRIFLIVACCLSYWIPVFSQYPILKSNFPVRLNSTGWLAAWGAVAADIEADGELEIIMNSGHKMYVINPDGSNATGWPITIDQHMQYSPAVGDIDGDGSLEILAQARSNSARGTPSFLYAWHSDGSIVEGFPVSYGGLFGNTPVLYDFDDDGDLEIVVDFNEEFYLLDHTGTVLPGWPQKPVNGEEITTKPSVGDIDGDGVAEIIRESHWATLNPSEEGGHLYVFEFTGELVEGWPIQADSGYGFLHSDAALADFDNDGALEIATSMELVYDDPIDGMVIVYQGDASIYPGWPQDVDIVNFGVSIGDINNDGILDIVAGAYWNVYVWSSDGALHSGWPVSVDSWAQPAGSIGNLNLTPGLEILTGAGLTTADTGFVNGFNHDGSSIEWAPLRPRLFVRDTPLLTDLEGDGSIDIVVYTSDVSSSTAWLYAWEIPGIPYNPEEFPWPMYGHDRYHTGQHGFVPTDSVIISIKEEPDIHVLSDFTLHQNYPNPFNPVTTIIYSLPVSGDVTLIIYNLKGREVARLVDGFQQAGEYNSTWNAANVSSGIYFFKLKIESMNIVKKMLLLR